MQGTHVSEQTSRRGGRLSYKWVVLIVAVIGTFMSALDQTIVNIAIPQIQNAFGADIHLVQWVLTGYILAQGVGTPTTAFFADTLGLKRFYIACIALFTISSVLCGLAWGLPILIMLRIIQGLSEAGLVPMSLALIFREFPRNQRGLASGIFGVTVLLAPAIGPTLGGYIVGALGWRFIFFINVPVGILGVLLAFFTLREVRPELRPRFDLAGFLFVAAGMAAILYGLSQASTEGWGSTTVLGFLCGGLLALGIFVAIELRITSRGGQPLLDLRLFSNSAFSSATFASMLVFFVMFGGLLLIPIYLQNLRGLSAFQAGLILLPQALVSMVAMIAGGRLVDLIGAKAVTIPGLLIIGFANWQLSFITLHTPYWWLQVLLMLRGTALGLAIQPLGVVAMSEIRQAHLPLASAMMTVARSIASSLGIAVLTTMVQTQSKVHYSHLAEQVTATSPLGQLLPRISAFFKAHGASAEAARRAALQVIAGLVQRQATVLAIQDAFFFAAIFVGVALIATLLVREKRALTRRSHGMGAPAEGGEEELSASPDKAVEVL